MPTQFVDWILLSNAVLLNCPNQGRLVLNKLQKLEDALVKQMLTAADRADQAERDDRTDLAEVADWADGDDRADQADQAD